MQNLTIIFFSEIRLRLFKNVNIFKRETNMHLNGNWRKTSQGSCDLNKMIYNCRHQLGGADVQRMFVCTRKDFCHVSKVVIFTQFSQKGGNINLG